MDCLAFHQWFTFLRISTFLHSSATKAVTFLLIKWSNDECLVYNDHRDTRLKPPSSSFILSSFFVLFCISVTLFFCCLFSCNLTWSCSLCQIKNSHLWPVSIPETKWEVRWEESQRAYIWKKERQSIRKAGINSPWHESRKKNHQNTCRREKKNLQEM